MKVTMGISTRDIPFFTDDLSIRPHTVTTSLRCTLGRELTVKEFAKGGQCSVEEIEGTNELIFRLPDGTLAVGPEV